jgi:hypothetical protein
MMIMPVVMMRMPTARAAQPHALDREQQQQARQSGDPWADSMRHRAMVVTFVQLPPRQMRQQVQEDRP